MEYSISKYLQKKTISELLLWTNSNYVFPHLFIVSEPWRVCIEGEKKTTNIYSSHYALLFAWNFLSLLTCEVKCVEVKLICQHKSTNGSLTYAHNVIVDGIIQNNECHDDKMWNCKSSRPLEKEQEEEKSKAAPLFLRLNAIRMIFFLRAIFSLEAKCDENVPLFCKSLKTRRQWRCGFDIDYKVLHP